jgi:hypothetical protein
MLAFPTLGRKKRRKVVSYFLAYVIFPPHVFKICFLKTFNFNCPSVLAHCLTQGSHAPLKTLKTL